MTEYLVRDFQPEDAETFPEFAALGIDPVKVPPPAFTGVVEGAPVACAGLWVIRPGLGEAWTILKRPVEHGQWIARVTAKFLDEALASGKFRRIQATVRVGDVVLERWMLFLGMQREGCLKAFGDDGTDHFMYARTKAKRRFAPRRAYGRLA